MSLQEQLNVEMKAEMKAKDKEKLATIRQLKANLKNEEIKLQKDLTEDEEITVITREVNQTNESLEGYKKATGDYSAKIVELENRLNQLMTYLPEQLSDEEVEAIIQEAITSLGATSKKDMGKVMGAVMPKLKGKTAGAFINQTVSKLLS